MTTDDSVQSIASLATQLAVPARTCMVVELMGNRALTATELATRAGIAPSTASEHLALLVAHGLLRVEHQGRHRYFQIASPAVADLIERMSVLQLSDRDAPASRPLPTGVKLARTCYDHLAGYLGVVLRDALIREGILRDSGEEHRITADGRGFFGDLGVDLDAVERARRSSARRCLDWSERRYHIGGALGAAMLDRFVARGYLQPIPRDRRLIIQSSGRSWFDSTLGIELG